MNDIDIDKIFGENLNVRPITEGLGFHHEKADSNEIGLKNKQKSLKENIENRSKIILQKQNQINRKHGEKAMMGDLSAFYEEEKVAKVKPSIKNIETSLDIQHISLADRFFAFFLDMFIVSFMFIMIVVLSLVLSPLPQNILISGFLDYNFIFDGFILYSLLFIFYFSFMDKTAYSTIGKNLLGVKLLGVNDRISLGNTFIRAISTYVGLFTLGLISILGISDIFSKTQLVKR